MKISSLSSFEVAASSQFNEVSPLQNIELFIELIAGGLRAATGEAQQEEKREKHQESRRGAQMLVAHVDQGVAANPAPAPALSRARAPAD